MTDFACLALTAALLCSCATSGRDFGAGKRDAATPPVGHAAATAQAPDAGAANDGVSKPAPAVTCDSTWQAIQTSIFAAKGCNADICHRGSAAQGGLDLSPEHAYEQLIYRPTQAALAAPLYRVHPGEQALSFLYLKLQAAAQGTELPNAGGAPMPVGKPPLSAAQLEAVRLWIRAGAPEKGLVADSLALLGCDDESGDVDPNKAPRPPVPSPELGFQQAAGPWSVAPNSETEVCFATYYDLTDSAPDWARLPCNLFNDGERTCVGYMRRQLTQDAQSHHSIIQVYAGAASPTDPAFGKWRCAGGAAEGTACDPTRAGMAASLGGADCGSQGVCQTEPLKATTCRGYGPSDHDTRSLGSGGAQSPVSTTNYPAGVYSRLPLKGVVVWNSHGFNLTKKRASIEQYNTFWYARPDERVYLVRGIFDTSNIFAMTVPPFEAREYCATFTLPQYAHLSELSSHVHKRGLHWRTWLPPNSLDCTPSNGCMPSEGPPAYESFSYNDPVTMALTPALEFNSPDPGTRTLKYCALFDNGKSDPKLVKRKSMLPEGAAACATAESYCVGGANHAQRCNGDAANCPGGACDACTLSGGFTTEDEMFILLGNYYVVPPSP